MTFVGISLIIIGICVVCGLASYLGGDYAKDQSTKRVLFTLGSGLLGIAAITGLKLILSIFIR